LKKGGKVYIEGRLTTRSWDDKDSGQKRYMTEVVANDLVLLGGKGGAGGSSSDGESGGGRKSSGSGFDQRPAAEDNFAQSTEITDEDIPF
jgi:single-strand DNA-binding protein